MALEFEFSLTPDPWCVWGMREADLRFIWAELAPLSGGLRAELLRRRAVRVVFWL